MASLLHCLFRNCFEHGESSDEDEDHQQNHPHHSHEDNSEELYCGQGTRRGSRRGRIAGARRRNYLGLASSAGSAAGGNEAVSPPYGNRISRGNSFRGENVDDGATSASSTAGDTMEGVGEHGGGRDGASCEGGGAGGFFRRWMHQMNRVDRDCQAEGTQNLLLGASSPARSEDYGPDCISFSPVAPALMGEAGSADAVSSLVAGGDAPMLLSRPPMSMPPSAQLRGLIGLVRRPSDPSSSSTDAEEEKYGLTTPKKPDNVDDDRQQRLAAAKQHNASFKEAVEYDFSSGREYPSISSNEVVLPGSELQRKMAKLMCRELGRGTSSCSLSAQKDVAGAAAAASGDPDDECVICMDCFTPDNPRMPTLCGCGENKTYFHLPCLYQWIDQCPECPSCRKKLVWEEF